MASLYTYQNGQEMLIKENVNDNTTPGYSTADSGSGVLYHLTSIHPKKRGGKTHMFMLFTSFPGILFLYL